MKKLMVCAVFCVTMTSMSAMAGSVGIVNMKQIFTSSTKVKAIKEQLTKQFSPEKANLDKLANNLQSDIQKYQKNKTVMSKTDLDSLQSQISNEEMQFRQEQGKFQQEVYTAQNEQLQQFMKVVKAAVQKVAVKNKLDLILPDNDVLYSENSLDITKQVLDEMK